MSGGLATRPVNNQVPWGEEKDKDESLENNNMPDVRSALRYLAKQGPAPSTTAEPVQKKQDVSGFLGKPAQAASGSDLPPAEALTLSTNNSLGVHVTDPKTGRSIELWKLEGVPGYEDLYAKGVEASRAYRDAAMPRK